MSYTPEQIQATVNYISKLMLSSDVEERTEKWLKKQLTNLINESVKLNVPSIKLAADHGLGQLLPALQDKGLSFPKDKKFLLRISGESIVLGDAEVRTIYSNTERKSFNQRPYL